MLLSPAILLLLLLAPSTLSAGYPSLDEYDVLNLGRQSQSHITVRIFAASLTLAPLLQVLDILLSESICIPNIHIQYILYTLHSTLELNDWIK